LTHRSKYGNVQISLTISVASVSRNWKEKMIERQCQWCGGEFQVQNFWSKGRFCSNRCRCAWNAQKRRVEKRIRRAVQDSLWLCDLYADNPEDELVAWAFHNVVEGVAFGPNREERKE
jgi:hypothetical protein